MLEKKYILKVDNCKICNKTGTSFFIKKYSDQIFKFFFGNFYGETNTTGLVKRLNNIDYELMRCNLCCFVWQKAQPVNELASYLYEKVIDKDKSFLKSELVFKKNKKKFKEEFKLIINFLKKKELNVLDYGAGWGSWLKSIDFENVKLYGCELSNDRNEYLKKFNIKTFNIKKLNDYENFFDYIRLEQVLEHLTDINECLSLLKFISKKEIIVDVSVPNGKEFTQGGIPKKISKGPVQPLEHVNCFSNKSLKKLFDYYGFRPLSLFDIISIYSKNTFYNLANIKFLIKNILNYFNSTTLKFKLK